MVTEKALEGLRGNQDVHENLHGTTLTHFHFVHLGSVGLDYPCVDLLDPTQKVAVESPLLIFPMIAKGMEFPVRIKKNKGVFACETK